MHTITLNNGVEMPLLGFGTYQVTDAAECERSVTAALQTGYRLLDTAAAYGNEEAVGRAIRQSGVTRAELFVTTKLWIRDTSYEGAKRAFETSLRKLGLDYLDLYLLHWPFNDVYGAWRALEELYKQGRIRAIGVSNFLPERLLDLLLHHDVVPAVNQIETHPQYQRPAVHEFLRQQGVQHQAWAPFGQGKINVFENEVLRAIAHKHQKTVAQVVLRWLTQRGIAVIPKSVHPERIAENFQVFDFELSAADLQAIAALDTNQSALFDQLDPVQVQRLHSF